MEQETEGTEHADAGQATTDGYGADAAYSDQMATACVKEGGYADGMPQLCFDWFPNQIFWLVVTLVVIFFVLSRFAIPRIAAVLAERSGTITNDIAAAEELKTKAAEAEAAYEKALSDARAEASRIVEETKAAIQSELDAELAEADAQITAKTAESEKAISAIRADAVTNVTKVAKDVAGDIVSALGLSADDKALDAAIEQRMKG